MGSLPEAELSLDFRPGTINTTSFVPKTIGELLKEVYAIDDSTEKESRLDRLVKVLEDEMRKIDAFKRELPLCMMLLNDVNLLLKEKMKQCRAELRKQEPVLEEFIPLKKNCSKDGFDDDRGCGKLDGFVFKKEIDCKDKKNWMSSVRLWNSDNDRDCPMVDRVVCDTKNFRLDSKTNEMDSVFANGDRSRRAGSVFVPFKAFSGLSRKEGENRGVESPVPSLSLTPGIKNLKEESGSSTGSRTSFSEVIALKSVLNSQSNSRNGLQVQLPQLQTSRKQRRCWSAELHRRFVNALQQLGGCQVATPKQIRELMQVDGLTNDEVKSHLQKYRLHTRRAPPTTPINTVSNQSTQSGSPQGPLELAANTRGTSTTVGDNMEDDEDTKSDAYFCKSYIQRSGKVDV